MRIYSDLVRAKDSDDFEGMGVLLYDLKYASQTHLMVENVRFYVYLQQQYSIDRDTAAFIAELRNCWTARQRMTRIFCDPNLERHHNNIICQIANRSKPANLAALPVPLVVVGHQIKLPSRPGWRS